MKKILLASVFALAVGPALADAITVVAKVDGSTVAVESSADGNLNVSSQAFGPVFNLNSLSINSETFLAAPDLLSTNTLDVNQTTGGTHQLTIDILATGLTGPGSIEALLSSFSVSGLTAGWNAREQTFINGNPLADTGVFTNTSDSAFSVNLANVTNPFSAEVLYTINSVGTGRFNGGIDISAAAVPGPIVGAGLPGLMAAFSFFGLNRFRRRKLAA
jgi:hypothetical protein